MKKLIFVVASLLFITNLNAQTAEEMAESQKRVEKLQGLVAKTPDKADLTSVDDLATKATPIANETIEITTGLNGLHDGLKGEGEMPTLAECKALYDRIEDNSKALKAAAEKIDNAAADVKKIKKPAQAMKASKALTYSKDVLGTAGTESAYQVKTIASIMETVKAAVGL